MDLHQPEVYLEERHEVTLTAESIDLSKAEMHDTHDNPRYGCGSDGCGFYNTVIPNNSDDP